MGNPIEYDGIWWCQDKRGYYEAGIKGRKTRLHRYIYEQAHGPIPRGYDVHHIDEDKTNNSLENLQMLLRSAHNSYHGAKNGNSWLHTPESIAKMAAAKTGKPGRVWTEESREKLRDSRAKQVYSEESKKKMSESAKNRPRHPWSEETKRKMSESAHKRWANRSN
jgi:hypothetical protein